MKDFCSICITKVLWIAKIQLEYNATLMSRQRLVETKAPMPWQKAMIRILRVLELGGASIQLVTLWWQSIRFTSPTPTSVTEVDKGKIWEERDENHQGIIWKGSISCGTNTSKHKVKIHQGCYCKWKQRDQVEMCWV